ncbi:MAG: hypothetical protein JSV55_02175 [Deltaproteobacteria bacterium]|nr:MAG: hypothetical protein JSV55_02175 [Deltaproteobacteria bacterium]
MTGTLVAAGAQVGTRLSVIGKSPMTSAKSYWYENMGGCFPTELKNARFDGVFIEGRAPRPVYLCVHDDESGWHQNTGLLQVRALAALGLDNLAPTLQ